MKKLLLILPFFFAFCSCDVNESPNAEFYKKALGSAQIAKPEVSEEVISDILQQIPSPLETSVLIKQTGSSYGSSMLHDPKKITAYNTSYEMAINLGIYGTDLGYTKIYDQNQDAIFYYNAIKGLADELSLSQYFDFTTIKRLALNSNRMDSLLYLTTRNFNQINTYLQEQKRSNLSLLVLTGGWLEALHIACQVAEENPGNQVLVERIGEQKAIMDKIMLLFSFYSTDNSSMAKYQEELQPLADAFSKVEMTYTYAKPTFNEVGDYLVVEDNSTSTVKISPENLNEITFLTQSIRNNIIN
ncbi:hypothetical protein [Nafulsella turpanensis]|uniref:hypothetical protein n=1 Tax=Nafulsella turpanensis TaxID=1265690 RepID=UPI00034BF5F6|nr:hypothetical protein [Nafulsella turpanensis]